MKNIFLLVATIFLSLSALAASDAPIKQLAENTLPYQTEDLIYGEAISLSLNSLENKIVINEVLASAQNGNAKAQYTLCQIYADQKKYEESFNWCLKSAKGGNAQAMNEVAISYAVPLGIKQDYKEAIKWYQKAANRGVLNAIYRMGAMNAVGQGTKVDFEQAAKWYKRAAEQGHYKASLILYRMYIEGKEVKENEAEAFRWLNNALEIQKDPYWALILSSMYFEGKGTTKNYIQAKKWAEYVSSEGDIRGDIILGSIYQNGGYGIDKNLDKAIPYLIKAAEDKQPGFSILVSRLYRENNDFIQSLKWLLISYQLIDDEEIFELRNEDLFLNEHTTAKQKEEAKKAAKKWIQEFQSK